MSQLHARPGRWLALPALLVAALAPAARAQQPGTVVTTVPPGYAGTVVPYGTPFTYTAPVYTAPAPAGFYRTTPAVATPRYVYPTTRWVAPGYAPTTYYRPGYGYYTTTPAPAPAPNVIYGGTPFQRYQYRINHGIDTDPSTGRGLRYNKPWEY